MHYKTLQSRSKSHAPIDAQEILVNDKKLLAHVVCTAVYFIHGSRTHSRADDTGQNTSQATLNAGAMSGKKRDKFVVHMNGAHIVNGIILTCAPRVCQMLSHCKRERA